MAECFARSVIAMGYGARVPVNMGSEANPHYPTWQERGRQLFGEQLFNEVLDQEIRRQKLAREAGQDQTPAGGGKP